MIIAKKINENLEKFSVSKDVSYKSKITKFDGKIIECDAFPSPIGTVCKIRCDDNDYITGEIIGFRENKNLIAVHEQNANLISGSVIEALNTSSNVEVGEAILGRVIDAFGNPIDEESEKISLNDQWPLNGKPINPMKRNPLANL